MAKTQTVLILAVVVSFLAGCSSVAIDLQDLPPTAVVPSTSEPGVVELRYYDNISGSSVSDLTGSAAFPDNPDVVTSLTSLQTGTSRGDNYGAWVRGFIVPQVTGDYRFFVSGDDQAQLLLSPTDQPDQAAVIASVTGSTLPNEYGKYSAQTSAYQRLSEGQPYYFEIRFKEGGGNDHFSVAWEGPGVAQQVIGADYLYSWAQSGFGNGETTQEAYSLGYRVGYTDGSENLAFNQLYPPLDGDGDGLYDNWEVANGLDPNNPNDSNNDPDGDLISAADEFLIGTRENNPDTDNDGITDGYEYAAGLDPLDSADASLDLDNDGYSNLEEYQAGTSVVDPDSSPAPQESMVAGFIGQYFDGMNFERFVGYREDSNIQFDWSGGTPHPDLASDRFSVRWSGTFTAPHSSGARSYQFDARYDDGVRMSLNGQTVVNDWRNGGTRTTGGALTLQPQETVNISLEFYENGGKAVAMLMITDTASGASVAADRTVTALSPDADSTQDTDVDGIPDTWELRYGLNAFSDDASAVNNNSGVTNIEAYNSGLHPFTLATVSVVGAGGGGDGDGSSTVDPEPSTGTAIVSWTAPTTRVDGSSIALSEIKSYVINYGTNETALDQSVTVPGDQTSVTIDGLSTGTWYFTVQTEDMNGLLSPASEVVATTYN
ncbi:fibronectin type III domain-containing protein [Marinobacter salinisoli]|uniref:Fibronectin type III domain-containing protein n=1 Tax=Marinobacter salinisoli TaxID=2769486 RepID=A0ABX7MN11_9GAMM|nr:PA14 domain-containing protein [Marinobacter salinisoli]QSP93454.1 fibronectin type III domain-containing protein [Marinobacter salinisoli]